jgi:thiamine biosynthesis lipoprotein ApbE
MDLIATLLGGPGTLLGGAAVFIVGALALLFKGIAIGKNRESQKQVKARLDAVNDQMEMGREADRIERLNAALADQAARDKAGRKVT